MWRLYYGSTKDLIQDPCPFGLMAVLTVAHTGAAKNQCHPIWTQNNRIPHKGTQNRILSWILPKLDPKNMGPKLQKVAHKLFTVDDTTPAAPNTYTILPQCLEFWFVLVYKAMQGSIINSILKLLFGDPGMCLRDPWAWT